LAQLERTIPWNNKNTSSIVEDNACDGQQQSAVEKCTSGPVLTFLAGTIGLAYPGLDLLFLAWNELVIQALNGLLLLDS